MNISLQADSNHEPHTSITGMIWASRYFLEKFKLKPFILI